MSGEIPDLAQLLRDAIDSKLIDTHVSLPATVVSFSSSNQTASVQPSLKTKLANAQVVPMPIIQNVPVVYPRCAQGGVTFPLSRGDQVHLVFSERSLDVWKSKGGTVDPQEARKFHLSDAVCYPGLFSPKLPQSGFPVGLEVLWGNSKISLGEGGNFKFAGATEELMTILSDTLLACSQIENSSGVTFNAAAFVALKARLDAIKG